MAYHCFIKNSKFYLFDIPNIIYCNVSEELAMALLNDNLQGLSYDNSQVIDYFKKKHVFLESGETSFLKKDPRQIYFSFPPAHLCNLNCKYCFADAGENYIGSNKLMSPQMAKNISEFIINQFPMYQYFRLDLTSGGEPLIDKRQFKSLITAVRETFNKYEKNLFIWMSTNGTLLTSDIIPFLQKNEVYFGISLDGPQPYHDKMRCYKNGQGTYDDITQNINNILNNSAYKQSVKELWGLSVITNQAPSLIEIINTYKQLNFRTLQMRFVRSNNSNLRIDDKYIKNIKENIDDLCNYFILQAQEESIQSLLLIANDNDYIGKLFRRLILNMPYIQRCFAGEYKFSFTANGDIYPCDAFVGLDSFKIGDLARGLYNIDCFKPETVEHRRPCQECWARYVCGGDCYHNSYLVNGSILTPDPVFCCCTKYIVEAAIATLCEISSINASLYSALVKKLRLRTHISNT